jgi:hypothetical protein
MAQVVQGRATAPSRKRVDTHGLTPPGSSAGLAAPWVSTASAASIEGDDPLRGCPGKLCLWRGRREPLLIVRRLPIPAAFSSSMIGDYRAMGSGSCLIFEPSVLTPGRYSGIMVDKFTSLPYENRKDLELCGFFSRLRNLQR